jgi:beta-lactamase class A
MAEEWKPTFQMTRRAALAGSALAISAHFARRMGAWAVSEASDCLAELEAQSGGRLGVAVLDTEDGRQVRHRADERFPMCSTFKFLAAAFVLARVDRDDEVLERRVVFTMDELVPFSPVTERHTGEPGMTLAEICDAAVTASDNTAGNLLLASFGGPPALTAYARSLGDSVTRLDRIEPELNDVLPGDPRDTTTPAAMLENLRQIVLGDALSGPSRERMTGWLLANTTGDTRLRAGLPADWRVGDKTGSNMNGVSNDIAVVWPPGRQPLVVTAYLAESPLSSAERDGVLAEVGRMGARPSPPGPSPSALGEGPGGEGFRWESG